MQIKEPQFVIVPEEDYEFGLNHQAYPEYNDELNSGNLVVLSKEVASIEYGITQPEENKVYVRSPYDGVYLDLSANNLEILFMEKKAIQIREALVMFGVYSATLENTVEDCTEKDIKANASYKKGFWRKNKENVEKTRVKESPRGKILYAEGSLEIDNLRKYNLATKIDLLPSKRQAKTPQEIRQYINTHGLGQESSLIAWLDRYERDGILVGAESIEVSFLEDLAKVRKGALNLKILMDEARFNIESQCKQTHNFHKRIYVDFSGPKD